MTMSCRSECTFFAGCTATYSGPIVVLTSAIVLAPMAHRILRRFHADA